MKFWKPSASGVEVCAAPPEDESVTLEAVLHVTVPSGTSIVYFDDFYGKDRAEGRRYASLR